MESTKKKGALTCFEAVYRGLKEVGVLAYHISQIWKSAKHYEYWKKNLELSFYTSVCKLRNRTF